MTQERLNALLVLEKGGYTFTLTPAGRIAYTAPADAPAAWLANRVPVLLARLGGGAAGCDREAAVAVLRARQAWLDLYDEWALQTQSPSQSIFESDSDNDNDYRRRLDALAAQAGWVAMS